MSHIHHFVFFCSWVLKHFPSGPEIPGMVCFVHGNRRCICSRAPVWGCNAAGSAWSTAERYQQTTIFSVTWRSESIYQKSQMHRLRKIVWILVTFPTFHLSCHSFCISTFFPDHMGQVPTFTALFRHFSFLQIPESPWRERRRCGLRFRVLLHATAAPVVPLPSFWKSSNQWMRWISFMYHFENELKCL